MPNEKIPLYQLHQDELNIFHFDFDDKHMLEHLQGISIPHRHDHYCCFFVEEGAIDFNIDFKRVNIGKGCLLVSYPGQIHELISFEKGTGWILFFDAKMVDDNARMVIEELLTKVPMLTLHNKDNEWFLKLFEIIDTAIHTDIKAAFYAQLLRSLLHSFIYRFSILLSAAGNAGDGGLSSRNLAITKKFRQLLQKNFRTIKKPSEYAEKMNFSVSYLNDTVKAVTGFPLTYFIQQEIVSEAQRLLYYSEMSIKEIAYDLGYDDDKYFTRIFGKTTGISPTNFRKNKAKV